MSDFESLDAAFHRKHPDLWHVAYACHHNADLGRRIWAALSDDQKALVKPHRDLIAQERKERAA